MTIESGASLDRKNLLAQLDHSLWSPLNAIYHYSESMLLGMDGDLSETARVNVQTIFDKAQSLHTALKKLLAWLPFEAVGLIPASINIAYVLNQAISMASMNFAGGQIHMSQDANLDIQVIADAAGPQWLIGYTNRAAWLAMISRWLGRYVRPGKNHWPSRR